MCEYVHVHVQQSVLTPHTMTGVELHRQWLTLSHYVLAEYSVHVSRLVSLLRVTNLSDVIVGQLHQLL